MKETGAIRGRARGRFAPSPSGRMHLGNVFSALLAWASARSHGAVFVVRLEDLDERCREPGNSQILLDDLRWLGLDWDGEPVVQHGREKAYESAFERLLENTHVYPCFCSRADLHAASAPHASDGTPVYPGTCRKLTPSEVAARKRGRNRPPAWRVEVPDEVIGVDDGHLGRFEQDLASECGDFIIRRSDGVFAYQLACVVDDGESGVTEVVRGSDLLSSAPRQVFLQRLLGYRTPTYFHHPLLLAPDGRRLSKRERDLDMGYIRDHVHGPEVVVGLVASIAGLAGEGMGNPAAGGQTPLMSAAEFAEGFSWERVRRDDIVLRPEMLSFL